MGTTTVRTFLLTGGAVLINAAATHAADLPTKAKPVEYVKVCTIYGQGFYYVPGTDICLKLGGYLRAEADVNAGGTLTPAVGPTQTNRANVNNRESNSFVQRTRILWSLDARTQTEYGTLRSYSRTGIQWTTGDSVNVGSNASAYIDRAFLQFAGFTAGRAVSYYDIYSFNLHSHQTNIIGSDSGGTGINLFAYTTELGAGLSTTLSLEEHTSRTKPVVNTLGAGFFNLNVTGGLGTGTPTSQEGQMLPNLVGNVRLDQAWGAVQASFALNKIAATYYGAGNPLTIGGGAGGSQNLGHPGDKFGFAGTVGAVLNLPWAQGDTLGVQFSYGVGASSYVGQGQGTFNVVNGNGIGIGFSTDAVYGAVGSALELTTAWSITAGMQHYWSPKWRTSLYGGYEQFEYNPNATAAICAGLAAGGAGSAANAGGFTPTNCSPNFSFWQIGSRTIWNPVRELDIGVEVLWNHINTAFAGPVLVSANGTVPAGAFAAQDQDVVSALFRVQRNFLP